MWDLGARSAHRIIPPRQPIPSIGDRRCYPSPTTPFGAVDVTVHGGAIQHPDARITASIRVLGLSLVPRSSAPPLPDLAQDFLHAKALTAGTATGNSDRARRQDLARWGRSIRHVTGHDVDDSAPLDVDADLGGLTPLSFSVDNVIAALDLLRRQYKSSTLQRLCSTLRSFCRWLVRRGHLTTSPFDDEILHVSYRHEPEVRAFTDSDVNAMLDAAATPPPSASSAWPTRDVAAVDVLAFTGVRAAEFCGLQIGDVGTTDRPILYIRRGAKVNKRREVPLPRHSTERLEAYLAERVERGVRSGGRTELFVRNDGRAMSTDSLYHLIKRVALDAGVNLPDDALVHGLRHHFGVQLALLGVPPATLQQLMGHSDPRTTALYTRHASRDLVNILDDAGWLTN